MKKTLKCISLILVFTTMLVIISFAADKELEQDVFSSEVYKNIEVLKNFGLTDVQGVEPQKNVTRAEMVNLAANMIGIGKDFSDLNIENHFIDIDKNQFKSQIQVLTAIGALSGVNGYQFKPDMYITYQQAVKILVFMLGYEFSAEASGGYPVGYMSAASKLKILPKTVRNENEIIWAEVAEMVINCFDVQILKVEKLGDLVTYGKEPNVTFLSEFHGIKKIKGKVTDNGITALAGKSVVGKKNVAIGNVVIAKGITDIETKIGLTVNCYYKEDNSVKSALAYSVADKDADVVEIAAKDILKATRTQIECLDGNNIVKIQISHYADVIYNGAAYPDFNADTFKIGNGKITLIEADSGYAGYDLILVEEFETCLVSSIDLLTATIYGQYGENIGLDDYSHSTLYNAEGKEVLLSSVQKDTVASIYKSKLYESVRIIFTTESISGTLKEIGSDEKGNTSYTINNEKYVISHNLESWLQQGVLGMVVPRLNGGYTFYLDIEGNIAGIKSTNSGEYYAFIRGIMKKQGMQNEDVAYARLFLSNGEFATVKTAKKICINKSLQPSDGKELMNIADLYREDVFMPQLVKVKLNVNGELTDIETAGTFADNGYGYNAASFSKNYSHPRAYYRFTSRAFDSYPLLPTSPIFIVPKHDQNDESLYSIILPSQMISSTAIRYDVEVFDVDASKSAATAVIYEDSSAPTYELQMFVTDTVVEVVDDQGQIVKRIKGYFLNTYWEFTEKSEGILPQNLKCGDVLKVFVDKNSKKLKAAQFIKSLSECDEPFMAEYSNSIGIDTIFFGPIYGKSAGSLSVITNTESKALYSAPKISATMSLQYDKASNRLRLIEYEDIPVITTIMENGDAQFDDNNMMFVQYTDGYMYMAIVVKK